MVILCAAETYKLLKLFHCDYCFSARNITEVMERNVDRISSLPRNVIGHILSFLSIKEAVATSVFSCSWRYLWRSINSVDFDDGLVVEATDLLKDKKLFSSFMDFVYQVTLGVSYLEKFRLRSSQSYEDDRCMAKIAVPEFLEKISEVQWLCLSGSSLKILQLCRFPIPKFYCLSYLELVDGFVGWKLLLDFCESSPLLETLIFGELLQDDWNQLQHVPTCLLLHLKKIQIKQFRGNSVELKVAQYFLKNSCVLENLTIHAYSGVEMEMMIRKKLVLPISRQLLSFSRSSHTCRVWVV